MRTLAVEEHNSLTNSLTELVETTVPSLLVPPSTTSHMSAMLDLKSGVGGSEASLFLADLLRMYLRLANVRRWKATVVSQNDASDGGGFKDALVEVKGEGVYEALRWESGVHRVQRVPATEASGRVHTSTVAVIVSLPYVFSYKSYNLAQVLPLLEETDGQNEELFSLEDVKIEVMRSRGAGGQVTNHACKIQRFAHHHPARQQN